MYEEEEVLEDQATTDQYQWSADNDPEYTEYTSPVSPQMTIQSPVRQREAVRVGSGFDIRNLYTAWIIIETHTPVRICIYG